MDNQTQLTTPIPTEVRSFLEGILEEADMTMLDEAMKEEMLKELFIQLDQYIASVLIEQLPKEKLEAFMQLNEQNQPQEAIQAFLKESIPNVEAVMTAAFTQFRDLYLQGVETSRNGPNTQGNGTN